MNREMQELMKARPGGNFTANISTASTEEFWERGFTLVPRVTTDEEINWLRNVYDLFFSSDLELPKGARVADTMRPLTKQRQGKVALASQILFPESLYPELRETLFYRNTQRIAQKLLSSSELSCWGHMLRKAPGCMDPTPWHQDEAYWDPNFDRDAAACWMPLEDATLESSAMSFVPGSHKAPLMHHGFPGNDPSVTALMLLEPFPIGNAVPQPVPAGGISIHHQRVVHGSGPNLTDRPRRAYVNVWNSKVAQRQVPHERPWYWEKKKARDNFNNESQYYHDGSFPDVTRPHQAPKG
jgi:hypothetical protein